ncbi:MAG: hypothetical protein PWP76_734 [Candidatus Diapherotrites archaeon]|nr:hypothetical protein [Candidatus Diapherotrites archaeon]
MNVLVVGAGPAGLRTSEFLAGEGASVTVLERSSEIRRKVCSGLLSAKTVKRFALEDAAENTVHGARIHAGKEGVFVERKNVAYVFDRKLLDSLLLERAEAAGAEVHFGRGFDGSMRFPHDVLVGADGFASTVRSLIGLPAPRYVMGAIGFIRGSFDDYVDIYLDRDLAPGFFAWVIPRSENTAEIGLGVNGKFSSNVLEYLNRFSRFLGFDSYELLGARPIPVDFPMLRVIYGNTALVGDAAVQTKATTGGGISYGLRAADALAHAVLSGDLYSYQRLHRIHIYPRLLLHALARKYLDHVDPERLLRMIKEYGLERDLSRGGDMDDPFFLFSPRFFAFIFRSAVLLI